MKLHDLFSEAAKVVRVIDTGMAWQVEINRVIRAIRYGTKSAAEHRAAHLRTLFTISRRLDRHLTGVEEHQIEQHTGRGGCWRANCRAALREIEGRKQKYRGVEV